MMATVKLSLVDTIPRPNDEQEVIHVGRRYRLAEGLTPEINPTPQPKSKSHAQEV